MTMTSRNGILITAYNPEHDEFSFSFAKRSFFIVGLNPVALPNFPQLHLSGNRVQP